MLGQVQVPPSLHAEDITFPCLNADGQQVLLSGKLIQLGAKHIKYQKGTGSQLKTDSCKLIAITLSKADWSPAEWDDAVMHTNAFVRKILQIDNLDSSVQAIWGRSLRNGKMPSSPHQATSVQIHASIESATMTEFLRRSGFNRLFCTSKLESGKLDQQYKIIWLSSKIAQPDVPAASALAAKTTGCLGLVRGKTLALGLRFEHATYDAAWAIIHPGSPPPAQTGGDLLFKVEGLPFGTTQDTMIAWAAQYRWSCRPIKALGPQAWLLRSSDPAPSGFVLFNSTPILIRQVEQKPAHSERIMLGPRSKISRQPIDTVSIQDPWANWNKSPGAAAAASHAAPRSTDGPIEARFKAQEERLAQFQQELDQLSQAHTKHAKEVSDQFDKADRRDKQNMQQMEKNVAQMRHDMEGAIVNAISMHTKSVDSKFQELKQLFLQNSNKRPQPDTADEEMG